MPPLIAKDRAQIQNWQPAETTDGRMAPMQLEPEFLLATTPIYIVVDCPSVHWVYLETK